MLTRYKSPPATVRRQQPSVLCLSPTGRELKGMHSLRHWGRGNWGLSGERLRVAAARAHRLAHRAIASALPGERS